MECKNCGDEYESGRVCPDCIKRLYMVTVTQTVYFLAQEGYADDIARNLYEHGEMQEEDPTYDVQLAPVCPPSWEGRKPMGYPNDTDRDEWTCGQWMAEWMADAVSKEDDDE
jgi:hypothetical protein